jgi:hypothetical protein
LFNESFLSHFSVYLRMKKLVCCLAALNEIKHQ